MTDGNTDEENNINAAAGQIRAATPVDEAKPVGAGYGKTLFAIIERQLKDPPEQAAYIPPEQMARALRANPGVPLPPVIHEYLCDFLDGKISAPPGRRADFEKPMEILKKALLPQVYEEHLARLRRQRKNLGREGWKELGEAEGWQGSPSERAAQLTCKDLRLSISPRTVQNIASKAKD